MIEPKEIRKKVLDISKESGNPHIPSAMSTVEILYAIYSIKDNDDIFILSKGHGCMAWYAILQSFGYNPPLKHHPDICPKEGIACTTGSLGHGLPIAVGMALARKLLDEKGNVYVLVGDGECQEGSIWESISIAHHYCLDNLIVIVDNNGLQALDKVGSVDCSDLARKFRAFVHNVEEINGHRLGDLDYALNVNHDKSPLVIIAHTIKGNGVKFMENKPEFHAKQLNNEQYERAYEELIGA